MVTYITNAKWWLQWEEKRGYASWKVDNILSTPVHEYMHYWIWKCTQKWYTALMPISVWPNHHQGIYCYVKLWGDGMILRAWSEMEGTKTKVYLMEPKGVDSETFTFIIFWSWWSECHLLLDCLTVVRLRSHIIGYAWAQPSYALDLWPHGCLSNQC